MKAYFRRKDGRDLSVSDTIAADLSLSAFSSEHDLGIAYSCDKRVLEIDIKYDGRVHSAFTDIMSSLGNLFRKNGYRQVFSFESGS